MKEGLDLRTVSALSVSNRSMGFSRHIRWQRLARTARDFDMPSDSTVERPFDPFDGESEALPCEIHPPHPAQTIQRPPTIFSLPVGWRNGPFHRLPPPDRLDLCQQSIMSHRLQLLTTHAKRPQTPFEWDAEFSNSTNSLYPFGSCSAAVSVEKSEELQRPFAIERAAFKMQSRYADENIDGFSSANVPHLRHLS